MGRCENDRIVLCCAAGEHEHHYFQKHRPSRLLLRHAVGSFLENMSSHRFYEQQASQNGLPRLEDGSLARGGAEFDGDGPPLTSSFDKGGSGGGGRGRGESGRRRSLEVERERAGMQEAASATVSVYAKLCWCTFGA